MDHIHRSINRVADLIRAQDPAGLAWDFRVGAMHRLFRIFNAPRFRLEPVDIRLMEKQLDALIEWMERVPATSGGAASRDVYAEPPENTPERMQFLYGLAWAALSPAEYADAANLLKARIANSNEDLSFLQDATCLDIATGIGRWALAMVQLGAKHVVGFDFSDDCLRGAEERLAPLPERRKIELRNEDLYKLPREMDEAFDFTCANGVIHHLPDPAGGLKAMAKATNCQ